MSTENLAAKRAYVMAGGFDKRLNPVVSDVPKPLAMVAGLPFLEHLLRYLVSVRVEEVVLCLGYRGDLISAYFGDRFGECEVLYSQEEEPLGTGGALSLALERFPAEGPFLVLNGDTYFPIEMEKFCAPIPEREWKWKLALFKSKDFSRYGNVHVGEDSGVVSLTKADSGSTASKKQDFLANSGVWLCRTPNLSLPLGQHPGPYSLEDYVSAEIRRSPRSVVGEVFSATFVDIGVPADYRRAQTMSEFH